MCSCLSQVPSTTYGAPITKQGCSFDGCGALIKGNSKGIVFRDCEMRTLVGLSVCSSNLHAQICIDAPFSDSVVSDVKVEECKFSCTAEYDVLNADAISNGVMTNVRPCFINTRGACQLSVSKCTIMGGYIGDVGPGAIGTVRFNNCTFNADPKVLRKIRQPVQPYQKGLERIMYVESSCAFTDCTMDGGFALNVLAGSSVAPLSGRRRCVNACVACVSCYGVS